MSQLRHRRMMRLSILALVAVLVVGCGASDPSATRDELFDQARDLGQALSEASAATQDAKTGFADPAFASRAIQRAANESRELAETAAQVQAASIRNLAADLVSSGDRAIGALTRGDVQSAEQIRSNEFVPLASELADLKRTLPAPAAQERSSLGSSLVVAFFVVVAIVGGVMMYLRRKAPAATPSEATKPGDGAPDWRSFDATEPPARSWDAPNPLYDSAPDSSSEEPDAYRSTKVRPIEIELGELLESTLEQVADRGWEVTVVCPVVHISGDPIRVQRAVLAALGNVHLGSPDRVGIIVEESESQVKLSIGHDAQLDEATTEDLAARLATQLELALATVDLGWSVAYDDEITLITVALGASLDVRQEAASTV